MVMTMKNTKQEIFEALQEAEKKIKAAQEIQYNPMAEIEAAKKEQQAKVAEDIAGKGILADSIVEEYNDLKQEIADKKKTLSDLYGIEVNLNTLVATINANAQKKAELEAEYAEKIANLEDTYAMMDEELDAEHEAKKAKLEKEFKEQQESIQEAIAELKKQHNKEQQLLEEQRKRDQEEYEYKLNRERTKENDKWEDEKASREKELAEKERSTQLMLEEMTLKASRISEMEAKIDSIPDLVEEAKAAGVKEGKAEAAKEYEFEKRTLTKDAEHSVALLQTKLDKAEEDLEAAIEKNARLQDKLDNAYEQMRTLATQTVQSTGGVKILRSEDSGK